MQSRISSPAGGPALSEFHELRQPLALSAAFHICLILLALFGLDLLPKKKMEVPVPISVTMAKPSDIARSNHDADPVEKPTEEPPQQSRAPEPPKPAESTPPPPPPPIEQKVEAPPPPPEKLAPPPPPKPPEKPTPPIDKLQPVQQAQPQFQQPPKLPALQKPAQMTPKPPLPQQKPPKNLDKAMEELLNSVAPPVEKADQVSKLKPIKATQQAGGHAEKSDQLTADEMEAVRQRLKECWAIPAGVQGGEDVVVNIAAEFNPDMTLKSETIVDTADVYNRDPVYRAAADSAMRALRVPLCNPLPLPPGRLGSMTLTFNPNKF